MPYRIMVVDDDREFRQEMTECLNGYQVTQACDGQEALDILKKPNAIDLIVLDVIMPGLRGTEVLKQIRKTNLDLPIIILTGQSSKDIAIEALKGQASDYLEKPFEVKNLLNTIHRILDSKNQSVMSHVNRMGRVKLFIERNCDKKVSLRHVAQEVCLSEKYLSRIFKEHTGVGFNEYRLKIRMQKAVDLLKTTGDTIDQVANRLGYKNSESFIRIFEKFIGTTPAKYRLQHHATKRKK